MILKSETYHFHRLDLTRQAGFVVTVYDEDGLRLGATPPLQTPDEALSEARKIVDKSRGRKLNGGTGAHSRLEPLADSSLPNSQSG